ncbi:hypothetical protein ACLOJK_011458 [Asimina triloba]
MDLFEVQLYYGPRKLIISWDALTNSTIGQRNAYDPEEISHPGDPLVEITIQSYVVKFIVNFKEDIMATLALEALSVHQELKTLMSYHDVSFHI